MPASVIDLQNTDDLRDIVHRGVEALSAGKIVALPTETVYGLAASALHPEAVQRLIDLKGRAAEKPFAFAVKSLEDALDYVPDISPLARRIARRCWPGPVTLVLDATNPDSVIGRLPELVRDVTIPNGTVGLRVPAHEVTLQILRLCAGPLVLTSANRKDQQDAVEGAEVVESLGDSIDLILDDGKCQFGQPSSVVKIENDNVSFLRTGVVDANTLARLSGFIALIVCTGNTCRSPMGEALLKKHLAKKIGCEINELGDRGVTVLSAGISAMPGARPSPQAVDVMQSMNLDISGHSSQPITYRLAQYADVILTLTNNHLNAIVNEWPSVKSRIHTLRRDGADVSDPIGMPHKIYESCAQQIDENLAQWVDEFDLSSFIKT